MSGRFVENYLLFQLAIVSHNFSQEFHGFLRERGMPKAQWRILINLVDRPGLFISELTNNTLLEQSHVTKVVDQLNRDGLVEKNTDAADRRKVSVRITRKGKDIILPLIEEAKKHEAKSLQKLDPEDADLLKRLLAQLAKPHVQF